MYIKAITTEKIFDKVKDEWLDFEKKVDNKNITSSYLCQRSWWKHFGHIDNGQYGYDKKLSILFLYNEKKELRAIAPFCVVKRKFKKVFHYTVIEFIVQQWGAAYLDIISSDLSKNEFNYIFDWLKKNRKYDLIHLRYIPEFTSNFDLKSKNAAVLSGCLEIEAESYSGARKKYYSRNLKHKLNRIQNKMKRERKIIKVKIVKGKNILQYFSDIEEISRSKKLSKKHNLYDEIWKRKYVLNILEELSSYSKCIFLLYNNKICAYNWGVRYNNKYYAMDASYLRETKELQNYSLGNIVYDEVIKDTLSNGITNFCFGTGIDSYKLGFTKKVRKIYNVLYKGNTLKSGIIYKKKLLENKHIENNFLKELNEKMPQDKLN